MEYFRTDVKVGVFVFVSLALLVTAAIVVGNIGSWFASKQRYTVLLPNANLLHRQALVSYAGYRVGRVTAITMRSQAERDQQHPMYPVAVTIAVQSAIPLHKNARVEMKTDGFIGDRYLDISPGDGELIANGGTIVGSLGGIEGMLASLSGLGSGLDEIRHALHVILADASQPHSLPSILAKIQHMVDTLLPRFTALSGGVDDLLQSVKHEVASTSDKAGRTLQGLDSTIAENRKGLQQLVRELNASLVEARQTVAVLQRFVETSQGDVIGLLTSLRTMSESLQHQTEAMTAQLQQLLTRTDTLVAQNDRNIFVTVENLREITDNLKATSQLLRANPAVILWGNRRDGSGNPAGAAQHSNQTLQDRGRIGRYDRKP